MKLTRRDAFAALAAGGIAVGSSAVVFRWDALRGDAEAPIAFTENEIETLNALAAVVYPSAVTGIASFIETYVVGRIQDRPEYARGMKEALATLDEYSTDWFEAEFVVLDEKTRGTLLSQMGVDTADPDPDSTADRERVRYYLVNELLYALYTSPTGGKLVGLENPQGYPGGLASYQRGPYHDG